jgi:bacteriorhodopsin
MSGVEIGPQYIRASVNYKKVEFETAFTSSFTLQCKMITLKDPPIRGGHVHPGISWYVMFIVWLFATPCLILVDDANTHQSFWQMLLLPVAPGCAKPSSRSGFDDMADNQGLV